MTRLFSSNKLIFLYAAFARVLTNFTTCTSFADCSFLIEYALQISKSMKKRSYLYELQPDPFDESQKAFLRVALFKDVENAIELRERLRDGDIEAAMIRAELIPEPFVLLAAANRAVHQAAHNRMCARSLSAELIYSLSPTRNISDSLNVFGIAEDSRALIVAIFDDKKGDKMAKTQKFIRGTPVAIEDMRKLSQISLIKKIYNVSEPKVVGQSISDLIATKMITKEASLSESLR